MRLLCFESGSVAANLALDEALLMAVNDGRSPATFRTWSPWAPAVVLGIGSELGRECDIERCRLRRVEIRRRCSGGASVLLERGGLCASLVAPFEELREEFRTIAGAHTLLGRAIVDALDRLGIEARCAGISDVAVGDLKLAGLSQSRKRRALLVHASVLVNPDMELMSDLLSHPPEEPDYRRRRSHPEFLTSLDEVLGPGRMHGFARALADCSGARRKSEEPSASEVSLAAELELGKYLNPDWTARR